MPARRVAGNWSSLRGAGYTTRYAHLDSIAVEAGKQQERVGAKHADHLCPGSGRADGRASQRRRGFGWLGVKPNGFPNSVNGPVYT